MDKIKTHNDFVNKLKLQNPDVILLGNYVNLKTKVQVQCVYDDSHIWYVKPTYLLNGSSCPICAQQKRRNKIQNEIDGLTRKYDYYTLEPYSIAKVPILCQCKLNREHQFKRGIASIRRLSTCPLCNLQKQYLTDDHKCLWDLRPDIAKYLLNPEDGYHCSPHTNRKFKFLCPICGSIDNRPISVVVRNGFTCQSCQIGSYPNRFMRNILDQLHVNYIPEYSPEWIKPKRYDFYFIVKNKKYIVEMDGAFHNSQDAKLVDQYKDQMANQHNINVIRIDCNYHGNRSEYIKEHIIDSELSRIFDLQKIDFNQCNVLAQKSCYELLAKYWNDGIRSLESLSNLMHLKRDTISVKLKKLSQCGIITENEDEVHDIIKINGYHSSARKSSDSKRKNSFMRVKCITFNKVFASPIDAIQYFSMSTNALYKHKEQDGVWKCGTSIHNEPLYWTWISEEEYQTYIQSN